MANQVFHSAVLILWLALPGTAHGQPVFEDGPAMNQFQRAVDSYAFEHRQVERRAGAKADQPAMAAGIRTARPTPVVGAIFGPVVAAVFRGRIAAAARTGCEQPQTTDSNFIVPRPNDDSGATRAVSDCVTAVLPRLPMEVEYRVAGGALVLVDAHANLVIDVLHAAFPSLQSRTVK